MKDPVYTPDTIEIQGGAGGQYRYRILDGWNGGIKVDWQWGTYDYKTTVQQAQERYGYGKMVVKKNGRRTPKGSSVRMTHEDKEVLSICQRLEDRLEEVQRWRAFGESNATSYDPKGMGKFIVQMAKMIASYLDDYPPDR